MSEAWILVAAVAAANFAVKAVGPVLAGRRELPPPVQRVIDASTPALLAALVVTGALAAGRELVLDARAAGLAAAVVAVLARAPLLVVVLAAAATTALVRAV